ncbi:MAG TPA: polyphosphate kinase 2 family protein [Gemmataceae bacterium]|nr:polyphosphate kinase 2 family protein [Gemmataceae bacterium]
MLVKPGTKVRLKDYDPADTGPYQSDEEADADLAKQVEELAGLQNLLYAQGRYAVLIVLQGMDTSGKDGTIRHVMSGLSPLGVQVKAFKAPTEEELAHDFLWRVHQAVPRRGFIGIFNRSHYEDVLAVRVHELVPRRVWKARYRQINDFERMLVKNDVVLLKFFLHISKAEQKKRLEDRLSDPTRYWKFSLKDIDERRYWPAYRKAYEAALTHCSTKWAPWHVVPADHKWYRNLVVAEEVVRALRQLKMEYPPPSVDLARVRID